ncbi:hypothetical protein HYALB_00013035 [Hymenoscyphus albidus]|uniref:Uncharacterized protein n=1 Tax=Hymenoscyphus albidus TaxID=595503 RepID=A0A9N9LLC3_9HELO|nr:hypothetical protein HYALB_00013035 [Hymenoscyphus albidus]
MQLSSIILITLVQAMAVSAQRTYNPWCERRTETLPSGSTGCNGTPRCCTGQGMTGEYQDRLTCVRPERNGARIPCPRDSEAYGECRVSTVARLCMS